MEWQLQEAKNRFSTLVDQAVHDGPQVVTQHGKPTVVVIAAEEYRQLTRRRKPLGQFLRESSLAGADLDVTRSRDRRQRDVEL